MSISFIMQITYTALQKISKESERMDDNMNYNDYFSFMFIYFNAQFLTYSFGLFWILQRPVPKPYIKHTERLSVVSHLLLKKHILL